MKHHPSLSEPELSATPPAWHAAIGLVAGLTGVAVTVWCVMKDQPTGIVVGVVFCLLSMYGALDALTTQIQISDDRLCVRDRILRIRDFALQDVESITFVPDGLFEIHLTANRQVRFPAGAQGLDRLFEYMVAHEESSGARC